MIEPGVESIERSRDGVSTELDATMTEGAKIPVAPERGSELRPGDRLGRYHILEPVGRGGMGVVYAAFDPQLERRVALKVLHHRSERSSGFRRRLLREAKAMAQLSHPNVVTVHEAAIDNGRVFLSMEFVPGDTVRQWLRSGERSWREIVDVFRQAALGLDAAHVGGLVHRDVKPDNMIIGEDGRVRLSDFGIARPAASSTREGSIPTDEDEDRYDNRRVRATGTPAYMAPEHLRGLDADPASDQYSLCVAMFEALCGDRPHSGRSVPELRGAIERGDMRPFDADVPAWLKRAVLRGLSVEPADRFPSMRELVRALDAGTTPRRRRLWQAALVVVPLCLVAGAVIGGGLDDDAQTCEGADVMAQTWNADERERVAEALKGTGKAFSAASAQSVVTIIDGYVDAWKAEHTATCETHASGTQSDALFDRRQACLRSRQRAVASLVELLTSAGVGDAEHAAQAAAALPPLRDCAADRLVDDVEWSLPLDPDERRRHEETLDRITDARTRIGAGRYDEGLRAAERAVEAAREVGDEPLLVRALLVQTLAQQRLDDDEGATATAEEAWRIALRAGSTAAAARAGTVLVTLHGYALHREELALARAEDAAALLDRLHRRNPDVAEELRTELVQARGLVEWRFHRPFRAVELMTEAVERARAQWGVDLRLASYINGLGMASMEASDYDAALAAFEEALRIKVGILGTDHPELINLHNNIGLQLKHLGRTDDAMRHFDEGYRMAKAYLSPDHSIVTMLNLNLGGLHHQLGHSEEAVEHWDRVFGPEFGEPDGEADARRIVGYAKDLTALGRHDDALSATKRVLAFATKNDDNVVEAMAHRVRALVFDATGRAGEADMELDRAREVLVGDPSPAATRLRAELKSQLWLGD